MRLILLFILGLSTATSHSALISRVVGTVGDHVVTSREVQLNYLLEQSMSGKTPRTVLQDPESDAFRKEVAQVLLEWMVFFEAQAFATADVDASERRSSEEKITTAIEDSPSVWKDLAMTSQEKEQMLSRKLRAKKFIRFKTESSFVTVTDREALNYFQKNRIKFGELPFDKFKDNIKSVLSQQQADERLREWFRILQKKYTVRHFSIEK